MRILLVDDHPLFVDGLRDMLTRKGYTILGTARDGLEALQKARRLQPEVILMDIQMPNCDGLTSTRLIKAELPEIKIVMLTMSDSDENLFNAIKSGACGYLLKTLDTDEFLRLLQNVMQDEPAFSPGLVNKILHELALQPHLSSAPDAQEAGEDLSLRQTQVLDLVAQGLTYKAIGTALGLTERTVKYHMSEIMQRLHLQNRDQVLSYARNVLHRNP
jgi:DNA-binding NarL/FixJ family response regulator